ncbi:MAG: sigma-70 family RNA polymerase sigma factor [Bacteroidales bacterium]|nr:sigma-70 family RNA polymerase sigma factor [Bacteroidales bacterium]MCI6251576.1 sigma-70 family RNA polymerase sigma factor [Bacteroidales bacterium]
MDKITYISRATTLRSIAVATALRYVKDADEAEDVAQEVLLKMWEAVCTADEPVSNHEAVVATWAKNLAISHVRAQRRHPLLRLFRPRDDDEAPDETRLPDLPDTQRADTAMMRNEEERLYCAAMDQLPYVWRTVLCMRQEEEKSFAEIAAILGSTEGSVRGILCKARRRLADTLAAYIKQ